MRPIFELRKELGRAFQRALGWRPTDEDYENLVQRLQEEREDLKRECEERAGLMFEEFNEIEGVLAEGLGYPYELGYGWVTGEHTPLTLAMEARRKLLREFKWSKTTGENPNS